MALNAAHYNYMTQEAENKKRRESKCPMVSEQVLIEGMIDLPCHACEEPEYGNN